MRDYKRRKGSLDIRSTLQRHYLSPKASQSSSASLTKSILSKIQEHNIDVTDALHILIVEDNQINQRVLAQQLERRGCIVYTADHGGEALDFLYQSTLAVEPSSDEKIKPQEKFSSTPNTPSANTKKHLSIVLLDIEMPVMDGLECVRRIRDMEQDGRLLGHVPVIAVTGTARKEHVARAMDAGMVWMFPKVFFKPIFLHTDRALGCCCD